MPSSPRRCLYIPVQDSSEAELLVPRDARRLRGPDLHETRRRHAGAAARFKRVGSVAYRIGKTD